MNYFNLKQIVMSLPKLKQAIFETEVLKRILGFMSDENMHFKNRMSEILKNGFEKKMLNRMEVFQNRFIMEDELVGLLRNDVAEMENLIRSEGEAIEEISRKLKKLSFNVELAESHFNKLKMDFNSFLSENI